MRFVLFSIAILSGLSAVVVINRLQEDAAAIEQRTIETQDGMIQRSLLLQEIEQLRCNPFYDDGDTLLITPSCELPDVSQPYGVNPQAYGGQGMLIDRHNGVDWAMEEGTPIRASHSGTVFQVWDSARMGYHGYGTYVKVRQRLNPHDGIETVYGHLSRVIVHEGQDVRRGQLIGYSGNTGYSSKPHLHFGLRFLHFPLEYDGITFPYEVANGNNGMLGWVDPSPFLSHL